MSCIPQSGGCEKPFTDVLVAHLNHSQETNYQHSACLDVADSATAQPEALYTDESIARQLVIERKSISWPVDYPYRHSNDHEVGDVFGDELGDLTADDLYEIRLPLLIEGKRADVLTFAREAAQQIRENWAIVASGRGLQDQTSEKLWWQFFRIPDEDREEGTPEKGLKIAWDGPWRSTFDYLDPTSLPEPLTQAIRKIYKNCSGKFSSYMGARRILLLDPHGDLQKESATWWQEVWANLPPPPEIAEIWSGVLDWVDDEKKDWKFECLYVASGRERTTVTG